MEGILGVENEQIGSLGSLEAVRFFGDLIQAEARHLKISPEIRISERVNVPDGGIDASSNNQESEASDLLKSGYSGFQIKTGTTFGITEAALKNELFGSGNAVAKENIGDGVIHCLDQDGHFTFVCFGLDPVEKEINTAKGLVKEWLKQCGYPNADVHFWGQSTVKGFLSNFPSLRLRVNGRGGGTEFEIFESWQSHGDMTPSTLSLGEAQKKIIEEIREQLRTNEEALHLRITGESGVGKTRLVLEALNDDRIRPLVIYTDNPTQLKNQPLISQIGMPDNHTEIVLVLDECSVSEATYFWNRLQTLGKRIRLLTIYNEDTAERNGATKNISLPSLDVKEITEILKQYEIPGEYIDRWAGFCEGSPRWAKIIGENLKNNSKDILAEPDNVPVVNRYIAGTDDPTSQTVRNRKIILCFLALFRRVGCKGPVSTEVDAVYRLINKYDTSITRAHFDESIRNLHDRRILQGEKTYYITPKPLQVKLWIEWWDAYSGVAFIPADFSALPPALVEGFNHMFRFAQESETAMKTVENLLGPEGPFADGKLLHEEKSGDFFLALTEASPVKALERLELTIGTWSDEDLVNFNTGRRYVIWAITRIAVWEDLFLRAMRVLLKLAEAENDNVYSNNSTGVFKDLFSLFSPTEESPLKRFILIEELLKSKDPKKEKLAIEAMAIAVEEHYTRGIGAEHQGLRRQPRLWDPREGDNYKEAHEYTNKVWDTLVDSLGTVTKENRKLATQTLMHKLQVWGRTPGASEKALKTAKHILRKNEIDKNELIEAVVHVLYYGEGELLEEQRKPWIDFYNELVPDNLSSLLNRHVAMSLTSDYFKSRHGEYAEEDKTKRIIALAEQAFQNQKELFENLPWLVTYKAKNGYLFGYHLGKQDKEKILLSRILDERRNAPEENQPNQFFLGGYLKTVSEDAPQKWEELFKDFSNDEKFLPMLPELAWRAGHPDVIMEYLLSLIEAGKIDPVLLSHFKYGVSIREQGEKTLYRFVRLLISYKRKITSSIALDVFSRYYTDKDSGHEMPKDLALEILTDPAFFIESEGYRDTMDQFIWSLVANKFLDKFGDDKEVVLQIGTLMLHNIGNNGSILDHTDKDVKGVLGRISESYPDEMWMMALSNLQEKGYFIFKQWLSSNEFFSGDDSVNESLLQKIKLETLWAWINEDVEKRAWFIASIVPRVFSNNPNEICLARELLIRYGEKEDVRRNLHSNFFSEGWSGRASAHHQKQLDRMVASKVQEKEPNVIRWLDEQIERRKHAVERAKMEEEREDFWN